MAAEYSFGSQLLVNPDTLEPVVGTVHLYAAIGDTTPVAMFDNNASPIMDLTSTAQGFTPPFRGEVPIGFLYPGTGDYWHEVFSAEAIRGALAVVADAQGSAVQAKASAVAANAAISTLLPANIVAAVQGSPALLAQLTGLPGVDGLDGLDGVNGSTGRTRLRAVWAGVPVTGDSTEVEVLTDAAVLTRTVVLTTKVANQSATPVIVDLLIDGAPVFGLSAPTITQGQSRAVASLPTDLALAAGQALQGKVISMGTGTGGTTVAPTPRASVGFYGSGLNNGVATAPASTTSATVPLPTGWTAGDYLEMEVNATAQPNTVPTGWLQVGSVVADSVNNFFFSVRYRKVAVAGEVAPALTFAATAGVIAAITATPNVEGSNPVDATAVTAPGTNIASASSPAVTTDTTTSKESFYAAYKTRFNPNVTTGTVVADSALTVLFNQVTSRGTAPNLGLCLAYRTLSAVSTPVPAYAATISGTGLTARWVNSSETLRPAAPSNPGSDPALVFYLTFAPAAI